MLCLCNRGSCVSRGCRTRFRCTSPHVASRCLHLRITFHIGMHRRSGGVLPEDLAGAVGSYDKDLLKVFPVMRTASNMRKHFWPARRRLTDHCIAAITTSCVFMRALQWHVRVCVCVMAMSFHEFHGYIAMNVAAHFHAVQAATRRDRPPSRHTWDACVFHVPPATQSEVHVRCPGLW